MRLINALVALCFILVGVVFGALNRQRVHVDLWFGTIDGQLGLVLLGVLLAGAFIGGLVVTAGVVWPLRRRINASSGRRSGPDPHELHAGRDSAP